MLKTTGAFGDAAPGVHLGAFATRACHAKLGRMDDHERAQAVALLQRARDLCIREIWAIAHNDTASAPRLRRLLDHLDGAIAELDELGFSIPMPSRKV
jgi:hypothetical protein